MTIHLSPAMFLLASLALDCSALQYDAHVHFKYSRYTMTWHTCIGCCTCIGRDTRDTRSHLGPAGSSTGVKEQSNILLVGAIYQFSGRLLHLEALGLWLDVHCMGSSQTFRLGMGKAFVKGRLT